MAFAKLGEGDKAAALFAMLNPIHHARTPAEVERYKVEPYVVAADIYSVEPHIGRGGWTWYTGSAGWMYRAGIESILGIFREGGFLVVDPCIPAAWPGFSATVKLDSTRYDICVEMPSHRCRGVSFATLDGVNIPCAKGRVHVALDGATHQLQISI
jgi:cyclic beta-1,2-glucan synthetase